MTNPSDDSPGTNSPGPNRELQAAATPNQTAAVREITLRNFLSFGPAGVTIPLRGLNVLIGPNGSGKSNLLEALAVLRQTREDFQVVLSRGGGVTEWIWKGDPKADATLDVVLSNPQGSQALRHVLAFRAESQTCRLVDERIENENPYPDQSDAYFFYRFQNGSPSLNVRQGGRRQLQRQTFDGTLSVLAQLRDPDSLPELSYLADFYGKMRFYREWSFGRMSSLRLPQRADARPSPLAEDFSNLGLFLNRLETSRSAKRQLVESLSDLYQGLEDVGVRVEGGTVQVVFHEGEFSVPSSRLSDGSLRFLALLAVLCDPLPPPLIVIEEPELGLHPDLLPKVADLLRDASRRTQILVTTHSDILVDSFTEEPESVLICEKHDGQTSIHRLDCAALRPWLENYRLGTLWTRGDLGGNRW